MVQTNWTLADRAKGYVANDRHDRSSSPCPGLVEPIGLITETESSITNLLIGVTLLLVDTIFVMGVFLMRLAECGPLMSNFTSLRVCISDLIDIETRLRPGTVLAFRSSIQVTASLSESKVAKTPRSIIDRIRTDILDFAETNS